MGPILRSVPHVSCVSCGTSIFKARSAETSVSAALTRALIGSRPLLHRTVALVGPFKAQLFVLWHYMDTRSCLVPTGRKEVASLAHGLHFQRPHELFPMIDSRATMSSSHPSIMARNRTSVSTLYLYLVAQIVHLIDSHVRATHTVCILVFVVDWSNMGGLVIKSAQSRRALHDCVKFYELSF
jgi:hypothetical protein